MSAGTTERKKPLGVRATPEQHRLIAEAARREHRSINNFVLRAAMQAADASTSAPSHKPHTQKEVDAVIAEVQAMMRKYRQPGRSLVDELIAERRAEAARE